MTPEPGAPGTYNWTQFASDSEHDMADRMSRETLIYVGGFPEEYWGLPKSDEGFNFREYLDDQVTEAIAEIEKEMDLTLKFHEVGARRAGSQRSRYCC